MPGERAEREQGASPSRQGCTFSYHPDEGKVAAVERHKEEVNEEARAVKRREGQAGANVAADYGELVCEQGHGGDAARGADGNADKEL